MFEALSDRLSGVLTRLTGKGALSEDDVKTALREVRVALLEADVSLSVARQFIKQVQEKTGLPVDKAQGGIMLLAVRRNSQQTKMYHHYKHHCLRDLNPD